MKTISKIITICLFMTLCSVMAVGQQQPYPTSNLAGTDTLKVDTSILYHQALIGDWYWAVQVSVKHVSGVKDTATCYLMESIDGTNYLAVVGAPTPVLITDSTNLYKDYIWSGGTGALPLVWSSKYLGVLIVNKNDAHYIQKVLLQKKITIDR